MNDISICINDAYRFPKSNYNILVIKHNHISRKSHILKFNTHRIYLIFRSIIFIVLVYYTPAIILLSLISIIQLMHYDFNIYYSYLSIYNYLFFTFTKNIPSYNPKANSFYLLVFIIW